MGLINHYKNQIIRCKKTYEKEMNSQEPNLSYMNCLLKELAHYNKLLELLDGKK